MGWFGSSTTGENKPPTKTDTDTDVFSNLDPSLRSLLDAESEAEAQSKPKSTPPPQPKQASSSGTPQPSSSSSSSIPQSQYGDRYAHLWKTYEPLNEEIGKSEQEKLTDVLRVFKKRKNAAGQAAQENCVGFQIALMECYKNGGVASKFTSCGKEARAFDKCYSTQMKFLQALGYMSEPGRPAEVDERIQMHADKLYQEQLAQDKLAAESGVGKAVEKNEPADEEDVGWWAKLTRSNKPAVLPERTKIGNVELVFEGKEKEKVEVPEDGL
ncbi:hypothetical protein DFH27DRAFT_542367 [Peziza echinospora]|nr:hypothetical protein DFH27DRAFT_542367 [Peziza echinospora]